MKKHPSLLAQDQTPAGELAAVGLKNVLGYQLAQAAVVCSQVFMREVGEPHELRPVEYTVLHLIAENPGCSPVRLAKALAVTKPNITMWVERLVGRGLVQRTPSSSDKRSQELRATRSGHALVNRASADILAAEARALSHLSVAERAMLAELLQKLARGAGR